MKNRLQLNELALHKSSTNTIDDFEQQINSFKNSNKLELKQLISKLYFQVPNTNIGIPASTFQHDNKKHIITKNDWKRLLKFIKQPKLYVEAKRGKAFRGQNYLYKYMFDNKYYGLAACKTKQGWLITTFFEDIEANIDNWLLGNGKAQPKVPTAAYVPGCSLSEGLNNIITHLTKNVNPLYEKFEKLETGVFATNSKYDVINYLKNKPKIYRIVYDPSINYYFIGDGFNYIHQDILEIAYDYGFYPEMFSSSEMIDYMQDKMMDGQILLFAFYPNENKTQDIEKSSDGYTRKYVYDFGVIYAHEITRLEDFDIYKTLGTPIKKEEIFEILNIKKLNKQLKEALGNTVYFGSDHFDPETIYYSTEPLNMDNTAEINLDDNLIVMTCNDEDIYVNNTSFKSLEEIKKAIKEAYADIVEEAEESDYVELYDGVFDELGGFEFEVDELPDNASEFADLILDGIENSYVDGDSSSASIIFDKDFNILLGKGLSLLKHNDSQDDEDDEDDEE